MKALTARIPESLLKDIEAIGRDERAERAQVVRRLLDSAVKSWKIGKALEGLKGGKTTLRTAAKLAGLTYVEMLDRASEAGISLGYSVDDLQREISGLRGAE